MQRLVLFDIDGTLATDGGASRESFGAALDEVYDYEGDLARYDFSGRTDPQIAHMVLADAGLDASSIDERLPRFWESYLAGLTARATAARVRALPGIPALVARLAEIPEVTLALLTGNIEPGARLKLTPPDLNRYFPFGAFGSDSARREELPPIAIARALERRGRRFLPREVVIIGDSIYDVRCGVPHDATTIAVASGKTPIDRLRAENPHHLFEDAAETERMIEAVLA
jgi:phosphoglycolate phosphatase-like HAD superfamily hydrolase